MEIEILNIVDNSYINVISKYGNFIGKWIGENIPNSGTFHVEIDFNKIMNYEIIEEKYFIGNVNGKNIICGCVTDEDDDFVQYIDVDGIIMINIEEKMLKNKFIKLEVDEIKLYPISM